MEQQRQISPDTRNVIKRDKKPTGTGSVKEGLKKEKKRKKTKRKKRKKERKKKPINKKARSGQERNFKFS